MNGNQEDPRNWASANSRKTTIDQATGWVEIRERQSDEQDWMLVETFQVPEIVAVYLDRDSAANMLAESLLEITSLKAALASARGLLERVVAVWQKDGSYGMTMHMVDALEEARAAIGVRGIAGDV